MSSLRYKRLKGYDVFIWQVLTSMVRKSSKKAEEAGITPQAYVDGMAVGVKELLAITWYLIW